MIKFFRHIRQNLLSEGKTGKYFEYAIGEIILVVFGILIALGINNWNSNRINNVKQKDYLIAIKSDLEKQIPMIKPLIKRCDSISNLGINILNDYNVIQNFSLIDSLDEKLSLFFYAEKFPSISSTFDELKSTGQINIIKNKSIRSKIISYYQNTRDSHEAMSFITSDIVYAHIYPTLKSSIINLPENLGITTDIKEVPSKLKSAIKEKRTDSHSEIELFNTINMRIKAALVNRSILLKSVDEAEQLLNAINNEFKHN